MAGPGMKRGWGSRTKIHHGPKSPAQGGDPFAQLRAQDAARRNTLTATYDRMRPDEGAGSRPSSQAAPPEPQSEPLVIGGVDMGTVDFSRMGPDQILAEHARITRALLIDGANLLEAPKRKSRPGSPAHRSQPSAPSRSSAPIAETGIVPAHLDLGEGGGPDDTPDLGEKALLAAQDFAWGLIDGLTFGGTRWLRDELDIKHPNHQSWAYWGGNFFPLTGGSLRLGYAAAAKGVSILAKSGRQANAIRNKSKQIFRGGAARNYRMYPYEELLRKYGTDDAVRRAAGRTNPGYNALGAWTGASGWTNSYTRPDE